MSRRYQLICVAPVYTSAGSYDDPDQAILAADAYHDVWDSETNTFITATCEEERNEALRRWQAKRAEMTRDEGDHG